ncbi:hypothetical protein, partial [Ornithobacterium rhinotracheale]
MFYILIVIIFAIRLNKAQKKATGTEDILSSVASGLCFKLSRIFLKAEDIFYTSCPPNKEVLNDI